MCVVRDGVQSVASVLDPAQEGVQGHIIIVVAVHHVAHADAPSLC